MFGRKVPKGPSLPHPPKSSRNSFSNVLIEALEDRRLLSAAVHHAHVAHHHVKHAHTAAATAALLKAASTTSSATSSSSSTTSSGVDDETGDRGQILNTIQFSQAPSVVQSGLKTLASTDSLAAPTSTQTVYLGNSDGIETFSLAYTSSGTTTRVTVDQNGKAVNAPTHITITWATLNGTGSGSDAKAAAEISAIATALALTAPTDTTSVDVTTASDGTVTYSVHLNGSSSSSTTTSTWDDSDRTISVDASGNPVGHEQLPFSVMPTAIQNGINAHLPSGATALSSSSTQNVDVLTLNGKTFYSTVFTTTGTSTTVTVDLTGGLATLPTTTTTTYTALQSSDSAAASELQTLATANGAGTISGSQSITVYNEGNGTTIYSVALTATNSTTSQTFSLTISVDQAGNPTVPPNVGDGGGCGGDGGGGGSGGGDGDSGDFGSHHHRLFFG